MIFRPNRAMLAVGLCLVGVTGLVSRSFGQQQADSKVRTVADTASTAKAAPKPVLIGSIDIEKVLRDYDKFKVANENIRAEALARHSSLMQLAAEAKQQQELYQAMAPGSPDAQKIEAKMTQLKAQFEAGRENAEREFAQKEAETMATIFNEITAMTKSAAKQYQMTFVVKYSDTQASGTEPNSVMAAMSRTIMFADPSVDITGTVTQWLNYRYKESGGPPPKATATPPAASPTAPQPKAGAPAGRTPAGRTPAPGRN